MSNLIQVDLYMSFVMTMMLAFGIAFELPLLIVMLNLAGILTHERFRKWRRVILFGVFLFAGMANPSPDPITMLILGGACVVLVEVAEFIVWSNDRRRARLHPDPYAGLADDELSPIDLDDTETHDSRPQLTPEPRRTLSEGLVWNLHDHSGGPVRRVPRPAAWPRGDDPSPP